MRNHIRVAAAGLCLSISSASFAQLLQIYEVASMSATDLGTLGGDEASALDINDAGEVVGWAHLATGTDHAFLYRNGVMQDVTPTFGPMRSSARGINNNTEIVGHYDQPVGNTIVYKPFYWSQYEVTPKTLPMVGGFTEAVAINDNGLIVGSAYGDWLDFCGFKPYAVQWQNAYAPIERLYCPNYNTTVTRASDVNNEGGIVGYHNQQGQFGWKTWTDWGSSPLYVPPIAEQTCKIWAYGTNEDSDVAGMVETCAAPNVPRAIFWDGVANTSKALGTLTGGGRSDARGVNNLKFVVGYSNTMVLTGGGMQFVIRDRAYIWHTHFGMKALPLPSGVGASTANCRANALSNRDSNGLIRVVGNCVVNGKSRAVRWDVVTTKKIPHVNL